MSAPLTDVEDIVEAIRRDIDVIGMQVTTGYTLADAIREGSNHTTQKVGGWVDNGQACALGAGYLAARARGYA